MELESFLQSFGSRREVAGFVLDFDGTMSQVVESPPRAIPVGGVVGTLESLAKAYRTVAVVSGRRAEDVAGIVGASGVKFLGIYGAEWIHDGKLVQIADADRWRGMASRLARDAEALVVTEGLAGAEVEYKDLAVSVHYRNAGPEAEEAIRSWAVTAAARRGFEFGVGRKVVEMRPRGVSKAAVVARIISEAPLEMAVVAGDDSQDVEAMHEAHHLLNDGALTIGVSSREEPDGLRGAADLLVGSPNEVVEILRSFVTSL